MTLEAYAAIAASERGGHVEQVPRAGGGNRRTAGLPDLVPRLSAMRRMISGESFAVFAASAAGGIAGGGLSLVLADGRDEGEGIEPGSPAARILLAHLDRSSLPLVWNAEEDGKPGQGRKDHCCLARSVMPGAVSDGIAFPVRFGAIGNGLIVFEGGALNLEAGTVFAVHRLAYRVMADLLRQEISRTAPCQSLSERELECLQWAGDGCKSEAIADKLGLSVHTVNAYLGSATAKLDSVNRIQAIAKAIRLGFIA
ncbi:MAG TPA: helix-turn-helix transcriptional regulator [Pararhizobium sp.]|nr:helix-turn-helix transcriptional regulator [Pararhizobium sp.]